MSSPASPWKPLRWRLEMLGLRAAMALFAGLPVERASALGGALLRRLGPRLPVQRLARRNLELALPELDRAAQERLLVAMWENLGRTAGEYPHLADLVAEEHGRVDYVLDPAYEARRREGGAMIIASAHFANWEVMSIAGAYTGLDIVSVVREPNNPLVRSLLETWRGVAGGQRVPKGRAGAKATLEALQAGKTVAILADQRMSDGIEVGFFGRPAMTPAAPAQLALRFGCPLFPARLERLQGARFRLTIAAPLQPPEGLPRAEAVKAMTQALNDRLEGWIREKPDDWMWLHRRWSKQEYRRT